MRRGPTCQSRAALPKKEVKRPLFRRPGPSQRSCASPPRAALLGSLQRGPGNQQARPSVDGMLLRSQAPSSPFWSQSPEL